MAEGLELAARAAARKTATVKPADRRVALEARPLEGELEQVKAELARVQADLRRTEIVLAEERRANLDFRARAETVGQLAEQRSEIAGQFADLRGQLADLRSELTGQVAEQRAEVVGYLGGLPGQLAEQRSEIAERFAGLPGQFAEQRVETAAGLAEQRAENARQFAELRELIHHNVIQHGVGVRGDQIAQIAKEVWWERNRRTLAYKLGKMFK